LAASASASDKKPAPADSYDELFARYLESARGEGPSAASRSLWLTGLATDLRARSVNDIVTIRVVESITGTGTADSSLSKASKASIGVPSLFGLEGKLPGFIDPTNLARLSGDNKFDGAGTTSRAGALTATQTARVAEVLPNGDLVIEGVREIEINGDRQIVVLTGVARVVDIGPENVISSASIAQLRIRYFGRGLMKDSLSPGWLLRMLNKIF
jgi:flagellar L-ring protein precursor FlgH